MKILFVCTGNTCRSPMAQAMFENILKEENVEGISVSSAGVIVYDKTKASYNAIKAMEDRNIDLSHHISRQVMKEDIIESDYIIVMTENHKNWLVNQYPQFADKIYKLTSFNNDDKDIIDPFGMGIDEYKKSADEIYTYLKLLFEKIKNSL